MSRERIEGGGGANPGELPGEHGRTSSPFGPATQRPGPKQDSWPDKVF